MDIARCLPLFLLPATLCAAAPWPLSQPALRPVTFVAETTGTAPDGRATGRLDGPTTAELQRAALREAGLASGHTRSLERRMRTAALLPALRVRVGRGVGLVQTTSDYTGDARLTLGDQNSWQFSVSAAWNLDRLAFRPEELRLAREVGRVAAARERLLREVARLDAERRRVATRIALTSFATPLDAAEARIRLDELTATLDAMTGGALSGNHVTAAAPGDGR